MALTNFHYDKRYRYYDGERRDRTGTLTYTGKVGGENRLGYDFTGTYVQTFHIDATNTTRVIVTRSLANSVDECFQVLGIENEDENGYDLHYKRWMRDKDGNIIPDISEPEFIQLHYDDSVIHIDKEYNPDKTSLELLFTPPLLHYDAGSSSTPLTSDVEASYMHAFSEFFFVKYTEGGVKPQLNQYYSMSFFTDYYGSGVNSQVTSDNGYDALNDAIVNAGDGTPITPILPSDDTSDPGGGDEANPDYNPFSDPIDFPGLPSGGGSIATGFIRVYSPSAGQLQALASVLWGDDFVNTIKKIQNDPMEAIISLHSVPFGLVGSNAECRIGNFDTDVNMPAISTQFHTLNLGSIHIPEHWASALDYSPYVTIDMFIPFCGVVSVQVDDIIGRTISVKMNVDIVGGEALVSVMCGDSVLYTFNTNIILRHPISQSSYGPLYQSVLGMLGSTASGFASGGVGGAVGGAIGGALNVAVSKQHAVSRGGSIGGATGVLGTFTPYLIIHRPIQSLASGFAHFKGYPSNITTSLGSVSGYTEVESVHLSGITCTDSEKAEIEALLYNGVLL